jgi:hypothetical protein
VFGVLENQATEQANNEKASASWIPARRLETPALSHSDKFFCLLTETLWQLPCHLKRTRLDHQQAVTARRDFTEISQKTRLSMLSDSRIMTRRSVQQNRRFARGDIASCGTDSDTYSFLKATVCKLKVDSGDSD